ncbi:NrsF family protein [Methylocapsa aurea]|uniref:NrsF family protein n=1 Tax=Methylocapsa aurea TaxID=663610 RepID=UPI0005677A22|nr:NrsF family protein [Methylocapsa aurea]
MKTGDLIRALAADSEIRLRPPGQALVLALIPGVAIALGLFVAVFGLRPQIVALLGEPRLLFKLCLAAVLIGLSGALVLRLVRPGADVRSAALLLAVAPALLAAACLAEIFAVPSNEWGQRLLGANALFCLKSIPFLSAAPLVAIVLALRNGAPEHPALAGAGAGLFAGAIGAAFYAAHCPDDSPLFVAAWYTLAIAIVTVIGAVAGARLLRW